MAQSLDSPSHSFSRVGSKEISLTLSYTTLPTNIYFPFVPNALNKTSTSKRLLVGGASGEVLVSAAGSRAAKSALARVPGKSQNQQSQQSEFYLENTPSPPSPRRAKTFRIERRMPKKRRSLSLQAILTPSFLQSPLTSPTSPTFTTRSRANTGATPGNDADDFGFGSPGKDFGSIQTVSSITSPRASPPPSYLIDDDPFANLTTMPTGLQRTQTPQTPQSPPKPVDPKSPQQPRSPLTPVPFERISATTPSSPALVKSPTRPPSKSLPRAPVPAHQKPAFAPKPSLPSLGELSRMNFVLTKKVRKGRVGAGLPLEPWDHPEDIPSFATTRSRRPSTSPSSSPSGFVSFSSVVDKGPSTPPPDGSVTISESAVDSSPSDPSAKYNLADELPDSAPCTYTVVVEQLESSHPSSVPHQAPVKLVDATTANPHLASATAAASPPLQPREDTDSELPPYTTDTEAFDSPSLPALSPGYSLNESFALLSRSASTSSSGSDEYNFGGELTSCYGNEISDGLAVAPLLSPRGSAASETDLLIPPPTGEDDYFSFPTAYTSAAAISNWRNDTRTRQDQFVDDEDNNYPVTSAYLDYLDEPEMFVTPNRRHPGGAGGIRSPAHSIRPRYTDEQNHGGLIDAAETYDRYRRGSNGNNPSPSRPPSSSYNSYANGAVRRSATNSSGGGTPRNGHISGGGADGRNSRRPSAFSAGTTSSSEATSEEDSESAGEDKSTVMNGIANSDDDVPLARSIPTALTAQKSIRKQVREERDQRRRERAEKAARTEARSRQTTLRPAGAGVLTSSQEAALQALAPPKPAVRPRTQTLPGRTTPPFSPEDLTRKLQDVQVTSLPRHQRLPSNARAGDADAYGFLSKPDASAIYSPPRQTSRSLHSSRSFYHAQGRTGADDHSSVPLPSNTGPTGVHRARSQSRPREERPTFEDASRVPVPRVSEEQKRALAREPSVRSTSSRPSMDGERRLVRPSTADREYRPPVPPLPTTLPDSPVPVPALPKQVTQQRVFVGDMQRYNIVEIDDTTSAGDVIGMLEAQGSLKGWIGSGEWMVWEVSHDFGMERPIRNFERIADVQASWNKDKMVNTFVARLTPLARLLSRSAIPSSSPIHAGYVEWESKRGKWSKRWLQLREHSLWISKRDNNKDETLLCSLSNFDAYHFTRQYKSPKPFAFALKSTDKLSFFENASDYKHVISCSEKDGKIWMEKILLARSYVLHQERNVLFNPKSYGGQPTMGASGVSRAATQRRPVQPLVSVANSNIFEPGSLLHRKM